MGLKDGLDAHCARPAVAYGTGLRGTKLPTNCFYSTDNLDTQLDMASANYVNHEIVVDHDARTITIAAIFI